MMINVVIAVPPRLASHGRPARLRRRWFLSAAAILLLLAQGCAAVDGATPGVYVASDSLGAPGWIGGPAGEPVWSPDGASLAWGSEDGLWTSSRTTPNPVVLAPFPIAGRPAWSPDGKTLAVIDGSRSALAVIDASAGDTVVSIPLRTQDARFAPPANPTLGGPAWSPDGARIAFVCWDGAGDEICVANADGTGQRQVTRIEPTDGSIVPREGVFAAALSNTGPPSWSPDGLQLAVAAYPERRGAAAGVFVVDLERGSARRISPLVPNSEIRWSGDGESLVFSASEKGRSDVRRAWLDGSPVENLTTALPNGARDPALASDGSRLAVSSSGTIVVLDDQDVVTVSASSGLWQRFPAWNPSGNDLAFVADANPIATYS